MATGKKGRSRSSARLSFETLVALVAEQFDVGSGSAHRALEALAADELALAAEFVVVGQQILGVEGQAVAEGGRFGGLEVGEGHDGQPGGGLDAGGESAQQPGKAFQH